MFLIGFPNTIYFIFWLTWVQLLSEFINPDDLLNLWQINKYGDGDEHTIAPTDGSVGYINDEFIDPPPAILLLI